MSYSINLTDEEKYFLNHYTENGTEKDRDYVIEKVKFNISLIDDYLMKQSLAEFIKTISEWKEEEWNSIFDFIPFSDLLADTVGELNEEI